MQYTIFTIPYCGDAQKEDELNAFLRSKKIVAVSKELVSFNTDAYWSFCIRWMQGTTAHKPQKIDYTTNLTKDEFVKYEQLKVLRKNVAQQLNIPAYAVFTNKELSEVCKLKELNAATLVTIEGVGAGRIDKIGDLFFKMYEKSK